MKNLLLLSALYILLSSDTCNTTPVVKIGNQAWMTKNLDVTKYRNGDIIPQVTDPHAWAGLTTGAWCYYNNDASTGNAYGKLYNWYAVSDPRGLAPSGFHIPAKSEWEILSAYLNGDDAAGIALKETGTSHWITPNTGATNSSGFTALPGGYCSEDDGAFHSIGYGGLWWSATENTASEAWYRGLNYQDPPFQTASAGKRTGISVRCLKD